MPCDQKRTLGKLAASALRVLLASAIVSVSPLAALAQTHIHASFAGIYVTRAPKTAPTMSVSLGADGTATVTQDPGQGSMTAFGHWQADGDKVKVTFNASAGEQPQAPMVFQPTKNGLEAVTWDHEAWGKLHPPTMQKGYKVKYLFWSTTMP